MSSDYELEPRRLSASDLPLIPSFTCGDAWWEEEVTDFLHQWAWEAQQRGDSTTTLFSTAGTKEIVGFLTVATMGLRTKDLKIKLGYTDWERVEYSTIPAIHIVFFGVHQPYQDRTRGTEILLHLLDSLATDESDLLHRPRFIHLDVWQVNSRAAKFYTDNGFKVLGDQQYDLPRSKGKSRLVAMILDRHGTGD